MKDREKALRGRDSIVQPDGLGTAGRQPDKPWKGDVAGSGNSYAALSGLSLKIIPRPGARRRAIASRPFQGFSNHKNMDSERGKKVIAR